MNNEIHFSDENSEEDEKIFSYDESDEFGPSKWFRISSQCGGDFQSPIDLFSSNATKGPKSKKLKIDGMDLEPSSLSVENNGHSFKIAFNFPKNAQVKIRGGPLENTYILDNVHWHWGKTDNVGSEHMINSRKYASEIHLVAYNSKYGMTLLLIFLIFA